MSAFFSSSELAAFSVPTHRIDSLAATDVPGARALSALRDDSHRFLVTALVSNNVANIAAASVATAVFVRFGFSGGQTATGSTLVRSGEAAGALDPDEGAMIRGVLDLETTTVAAVMVPRTDVVALPDTATPAEALSRAAAEGVTRMPVYGENRDDVVGTVDVRDAIAADERGDDLASALREPTFVPETKLLNELFAEMRAGRARMVVVVDEHGAVVGTATLEDLFEEVVGELVGRWETDAADVVAPDAAVVRGWTTVSHLNETLGLSLPTAADAETVAGLVSRQLGRLPREGDRVAVGDVTLAVTGATEARVTRVRVEHADENGFALDAVDGGTGGDDGTDAGSVGSS